MPDTPIDLSEGIQSVRLKVPTAEVPIPPEGFAQLHSPAPGALALRLPDGSVVPVGGGGGGVSDTLVGSGGIITAAAGNGPANAGLSLLVGAGLGVYASGPFIGADGLPLGVRVAPVLISSAELLALHTTPKVLVAAPGGGRRNLLLAADVLYTPGAAAYTGAGSATFELSYDGLGPGNTLTTINPVDLNSLVATWWSMPLFTNDFVAAAVVNKAIVAQLSGGPLLAGDGTLLVTAAYLVL